MKAQIIAPTIANWIIFIMAGLAIGVWLVVTVCDASGLDRLPGCFKGGVFAGGISEMFAETKAILSLIDGQNTESFKANCETRVGSAEAVRKLPTPQSTTTKTSP